MEREMPGTKDSPPGEATRPETIERLQAGVGPALALLAGMQLEVFTHLAGRPRDLARRIDFSACRSVVDIGGGSGGLVAALCEAYPALRGTLFDLPRTAALAEDILRATLGGERVSIETGDILARAPSEMHDAAVLRALVQVLSSADAARAIAHAAAALRPGGAIYILGGGILDDSRLAPRAAVFLNVTLMNLYRSGASYTIAEHAAWLAAAGCGAPERIRLPSGGSIIRAEKLSPASPTP